MAGIVCKYTKQTYNCKKRIYIIIYNVISFTNKMITKWVVKVK